MTDHAPTDRIGLISRDWPGDDRALPFSIQSLSVRGRIVTFGSTLNTILARHDYPRPVKVQLGEAIVLAALLASTIKDAARFILQVQTDGPIKVLVADIRQGGEVRATASYDADRVAALIAANKADSANLLGTGTLAMTVEQGRSPKRYQGVVALDGTNLESAAHAYFRQSEQIPTWIRMAVAEMIERDNQGNPCPSWRAGGFIAQYLPAPNDRARAQEGRIVGSDMTEAEIRPDETEAAWGEVLALADTIEDHELTDPAITADRLLYRLFHEHEVRIYEPQTFQDKCSCSRERIEVVLANLSPDEVESAVIDGTIEVVCEFCGMRYEFDPPARGTS